MNADTFDLDGLPTPNAPGRDDVEAVKEGCCVLLNPKLLVPFTDLEKVRLELDPLWSA